MADFDEFRFLNGKNPPAPRRVWVQIQEVTDPAAGGTANIVATGDVVNLHWPKAAAIYARHCWTKGGGPGVFGSCPNWNRIVVRVKNAQGNAPTVEHAPYSDSNLQTDLSQGADVACFTLHLDPAHGTGQYGPHTASLIMSNDVSSSGQPLSYCWLTADTQPGSTPPPPPPELTSYEDVLDPAADVGATWGSGRFIFA